MPTAKITGKRIPGWRIEFVKCIEGHIGHYDRKDLLTKQGVVCSVCNTPITLSVDEKRDLEILEEIAATKK
ncbi:MAG: hypothetical protein A2942_03550 [Candidatus Lloydbacteria bacterium RIFCSPLOWO2_01_FULL_50_20]|uniref:Uncharacterized protein n=1 Tax=Candidatus Lloydbacteria bacterium RIFCSPLOWO2_01_FULL_50_20 TaxID=1798665 RepID=A0A1G2DGV7_9BACT|nr:MAG: hypothetical protein A3C13_01835 [Candidatus Lloydbacteria bacterium RIFCSPHIGHO2_02_FULL_50_11]OGZ12816.1 MAG: hypothetical protein A2942_03550 [Candidatus Lloydbacteria bacterium RIFCSPLOWO2_01_FULL_50_20]